MHVLLVPRLCCALCCKQRQSIRHASACSSQRGCVRVALAGRLSNSSIGAESCQTGGCGKRAFSQGVPVGNLCPRGVCFVLPGLIFHLPLLYPVRSAVAVYPSGGTLPVLSPHGIRLTPEFPCIGCLWDSMPCLTKLLQLLQSFLLARTSSWIMHSCLPPV